MEREEVGCYEKYVERRMTSYDDETSKRAKKAFDSALKEVDERYERDSELFDCYSRSFKIFSTLSDSQLQERKTDIESKMITTNLQFFSLVSNWIDSGVDRVYNSLRPLRGVGRELKNLLRDAAKERILGLLERAISRFLEELRRIAARLHVESYSIGLSVAVVQLSLTFRP